MALTGSLWHLALAVAVFLASHSLTSRPAFRCRLEATLGRPGFVLAYSALSVLLLAWVVAAAMDAPLVVLWTQEGWMRWVPLLVMPFASILLVAGMTSGNPFSIGPGRSGDGWRQFDPERPGILRLNRHPVLWALALWAWAHVVPNGNWAALMVFVPLGLLAMTGPAMLDAKRRRTLGEQEWSRLALLTGKPAAIFQALVETGWLRIGGGTLLYLALIALHPHVIGLSPLP